MTVENINLNVKTNAGDATKQIRALSDALERVRNSGKSITRGGTTKAVADVGSSAKAATASMGKLFASIKRIAFYRLLRTIIKEISQAFQEGLKHAYAFSKAAGTALAPALDRIASASGQMRNQIGAAFGELLMTIEPIILAIVSLINQLMQAMSALFAAVGGRSTYSVADKTADGWDKATGAAKKYKNTILGFDEINRLNDESGGGGSNELGANGKFFDVALPEWANRIKEDVAAIKQAFFDWWNDPTAEKFWKLLSSISKLLTDLSKDINAIAFDKVLIPIGEFLDKIGQSLGMDFNFTKNLTQLRDDINGFLDAFQAFMENPSWQNFSGVIREIFNILDTIVHLVGDPAFEVLIKVGGWIDEIGAAFGQEWHIADTLREWKEAFDKFDLVTWWETKGKPGIDGFRESASEFFKELPNNVSEWLSSLPDKISLHLTGAKLRFIEWKNSIKNWAETTLPQVATQIGDFFNNFPERLGYWLGYAYGKIVSWVVDSTIWVGTEFPKMVAEWANYFEDFSTKVGEWFAKAYQKIVSWKDDIKTWADEELPGLIDNIISFFEDLPSRMFTIGKDMIVKLWNGWQSNMNWLGEKVTDFFSGFGSGFLDVSNEWRSKRIPQAASGGEFTNDGTLFVAGEAGAEVVANLGGKTGVMNVEQMEAAVANGNTNVINAIYGMANMIVKAVESIDPDITLDGESMADAMYRYNQNAQRRHGAAMVTG